MAVGKLEHVSIRLTEEYIKSLDQIADREEVPRTILVRQAVREFIRKYEADHSILAEVEREHGLIVKHRTK